jgi:competence protein ComEA
MPRTPWLGCRRPKAEWQSKVTEMLQETEVPPADEEAIVAYLAKNFPKPAPKVNVNKTTAKELEAGLGLAAKHVEAIVRYREQKGAFKTLDDLKKVPGLDPAKIESGKDRPEF